MTDTPSHYVLYNNNSMQLCKSNQLSINLNLSIDRAIKIVLCFCYLKDNIGIVVLGIRD